MTKGEGSSLPSSGLEREDDWKPIESKAAKALSDDPTTMGVDPERRQALPDLMALHLLRSSETLASYNRLFADQAAEVLHDTERDPDYQAVLRSEDMSPEEGRQTIDLAIRNADVGLLPRLHQQFAASLPNLLDGYRELLQKCGVRLHRPERQTGFLLGDGPAFLSTTGRLGNTTTTLFGQLGEIAHGSPLDDDEWCAWMPLTPRLLAVAGAHVLGCNGVRPLAAPNVDQFNVAQCRRAQFVWCSRLIIQTGCGSSWSGTQAGRLRP